MEIGLGVLVLMMGGIAFYFFIQWRVLRRENTGLSDAYAFQLALSDALEKAVPETNVYALGRSYEYLYLNKAHREDMKKAFGATAELAVNKVLLLPSPVQAQYKSLYDRALSGETFSHRQAFGARHLTFSLSPIQLNESIIGVAVECRDTTEHHARKVELDQLQVEFVDNVKKQTAGIHAQYEILTNLVSQLPGWLDVVDEQGNVILEDGAHKFRLSRDLRAEDVQLLKDGRDQSFEMESTRQDGIPSWLLVNKRRMCIGESNFILTSITDISHLKSTQKALEQSNSKLYGTLEKLKSTQLKLVSSEKLASVSWLTSGLMHEINNAMNYIAGAVGPLQRDFEDLKVWIDEQGGHTRKADVDEVINETEILLQNVAEGADRVMQLISNLRAFSGARSEISATCDVNENLRSITQLLAPRIDDRIRLVEDYGDIPSIYCVASQLSQLFLNILENAIEAIEHQGTIKIRTYLRDEDNIVEIMDSGTGVPEKIRFEIFDPFYTTKGHDKSGLGLAISRELATKMGGSIEVDKGIEGGAMFRIILPVTPN